MKPAAKLKPIVWFVYLLPLMTLANGLVPCEGPDCNFCKLATLIDNVIHFMLFDLALPISIIMFIVAGIIFLTSGDNPERIKQGKNIFKYTFIGLVVAFAAWLIVDTILGALLRSDYKPWNEFPRCESI